jgi:hypothetical protein
MQLMINGLFHACKRTTAIVELALFLPSDDGDDDDDAVLPKFHRAQRVRFKTSTREGDPALMYGYTYMNI